MKKYRLTDETNSLGLHRIEALIDGPWGPAGTKGGWIESEANLSQDGICWVADDAQVCSQAWVSGNGMVWGKAQVFGRAQVCGESEVYGNAKIFDYAQIYGYAQVFEEAQVHEKAKVFGAAQVYGAAQVSGEVHVRGDAIFRAQAKICETTDYLLLGPMGSRDAILTVYRTLDGVRFATGCFDGTVAEFFEAIERTHGDSLYAKQYRAALMYATAMMELSLAAN